MRFRRIFSDRSLNYLLITFALLTTLYPSVPIFAKQPNQALDKLPDTPTITIPQSIDASGGYDNYGYRWIDNNGEPGGPTYSWIDISSTGTSCGISGDESLSAALPIGFTFNFYGTAYTQFKVSTNGWITLNTAETITSYSNVTIPTSTAPNALVAPFWDDLVSTNIRYQLVSGNLVVSWIGTTRSGATGTYTFQAILYPSGIIVFQYNSLGTTVNSATIGVENATGTIGSLVNFNISYAVAGRAVRIYPDATYLGMPVYNSPVNGVTNQRNMIILNWQSAVNATGYDVYLNTFNPPTSQVVSNQTGLTYPAFSLVDGMTYYWKIVSRNSTTTNTGAVWSFTIRAADAGGYRWHDNFDNIGPEFAWVDISTTGTTVYTGGDDSTSSALPIGFPFYYYGQYFTHFKLCTNGWITLDTSTTSTVYNNTSLPNAAVPNSMIAPYWDDLTLNTGTGNYVKYQTLSNQLIVTWHCPRISGTGTCEFQAILKQSDNSILFQYDSIGTINNSATIGIENSTGTTGTLVAYNSSYAVPGLAVRINNPTPEQPTNLLPVTGTINSVLNPTLSWNATATTTGYDVYLGTTNPPTTIVSSNQSGTSYVAGLLAGGTLYYWKVMSRNGDYTTTSNVSSFTTLNQIPANSFPMNGGNAAINDGLRWNSCIGADGYDVYFGMSNPPPMKIASNITDTTFNPGSYTASSTYYWKVVSKYGSSEFASPVWSFHSQSGIYGFPDLISPQDCESGIPRILEFTWTMHGYNTYDVYLSTSLSDVVNFEPSAVIASNWYNLNPIISTLNINTTYYWRIKENSNPPGTTHISAPRMFTTHPGMTGSIEMGGMDYPSFASVLSDLTYLGIGSSGLTVNVLPGIYRELVTITPIYNIGASNPLVFRCATRNATIVAPGVSTDIVTLNGASWITFDGINVSDQDGFGKNGFRLLNGASHNTISNSSITLTRGYSFEQTGIVSNHDDANTESSNSYNRFLNLKISGCLLGMFMDGIVGRDSCNEIGSTTANPDDPNRFTVGATNSVGYGIFLNRQFGINVHDCTIQNVALTTSDYTYGIQAQSDVAASQFVRNRIHNLSILSGSGMVFGIDVGYTNNVIQIANNVIYDLRNNSQATGFRVFGIYSEGNSDIVHNTVVLDCDSTYGSACARIQTGIVRNNIFVNASYGSHSATNRHVIYYRAWQSGTIDNNVLYCPIELGGGAAVDVFTPESAVPWSTWKSSTVDPNSYWGDPCLSAMGTNLDYHLLSGSPALFRGSPISWAMTDFDSTRRNPVTPAAGVDEPLAVKLIKPAGGDAYPIGQVDTIKYNVSGVQSVNVELNRASGIGTWTSLSANIPETSHSYLWNPVTAPATTHARIKITSVQNPTMSDSNSTDFSIFEPTLSIVYPNGGESIIYGRHTNVSWTTNLSGTVRLEYSREAATTRVWSLIANGLPASGSFDWCDSLLTAATQGRIRVVSERYPTLTDMSDSDFSLVIPIFSLLNTSTVDTIYVGMTDTIRWQSNVGGHVRIKKWNSIPPGSWVTIFDNVPNTGSYIYSVDSSLFGFTNTFGRYSGQTNFRLESVEEPFRTSTSDNVKIYYPLSVINYNSYSYGPRIHLPLTLQWLPSNLPGNVRIDLNRNYPTGTWEMLFDTTPNDGNETWTVTAPAASAVFRISSISQPQYTSLISYSLLETIFHPSGIDTFFVGQQDTINWNYGDWHGATNYTIKLNRAYPGPIWITLANNVSSSSYQYLWMTSGAPTNSARIAVIPNGYPQYGDTTETFAIVNRQAVITRPAGGEQLIVGRPDSICWSTTYPTRYDVYVSRNGIDPVELELIASGVSSTDGHCHWTPTAPLSDNAYIYIVDTDLGIDDWSDVPFRIVSSTITISRPNDGEHFYFGLQDTIRWNSYNLSDTCHLAVDLRRGYTAQWENIIASTPNTGSVLWSPTGVANQNSKIRIRSVSNAAIWDTSDYTFNIENYSWLLAFLAKNPNTGTALLNEWSPPIPYDASTGNRPPVDIHFPAQSAGHPNPDTVRVFYRRSDTDDLAKRINRYWTIDPSSKQFESVDLTLRFSTADLPFGIADPVNADPGLMAVYSDDDGLTWIYEPGGACTVDNLASGTSGGTTFQFSVAGISHMSMWALTNDGLQPRLTYPNGNDTIVIGNTITFRWTNSIRGGNVAIQVNRNYPSSNWESIITSTANDSLENWVVSGAITSAARFRIVSTLYTSDGDTSNANTVIRSSGAMPVVSVTYPNGGEAFRVGAVDTIRWSAPTLSGNVSIQLNRNYPSTTWETLFSNTANDGKEAWTIAGTETVNARIRIRSYTTPTVGDTSDANFEIYKRTVKIGYPNSGEILTLNVADTIKWTSRDVTGNVQIKYTRSYPNPPWLTVPGATAVPVSRGYYLWTPSGTSTTNARIAIIPASYATAADTSDAAFSIQDRQITLTRPNGGEAFIRNRADTIRWVATYTGNVSLFLLRNGINGIEEIISAVDTIPSRRGYYVWTPTGTLTDSAYIHIVDTYYGLEDWSAAPFKIVNSSVSVTRPNDGEIFYLGLPDTIKWSNINLTGNVAIDLRRTITGSWENLAANQTNGGTLVWMPTGNPTISAKIRIRGVTETTTSDTSDFPFSVSYYPWSSISLMSSNPSFLVDSHIAWSPVIPYDLASNSLPPVELSFPTQTGLYTNPDRIELSYSPYNIDALTPERTITRCWITTPTQEQYLNASLGLRFTTSNLPSGIGDPLTSSPAIHAVYSDDGGTTWHFQSGGTIALDNGTTNSYKFTLNNLNHLSQWALTNGGLEPMVVRPNGSETLYLGHQDTIRWSSKILGGTVTIQLDRNYPSGTWETLFASIPNDSLEVWTVSGATTNNARLRIFSDWFATDGDTSNLVFHIAGIDTPAVPRNLSVSVSNQNTLLTWSRVDSSTAGRLMTVTGYRVYSCDTYLSTWLLRTSLSGAANTSWTDTNAVILAPKRFYRVRAFTDNSSDDMAPSDALRQTALPNRVMKISK